MTFDEMVKNNEWHDRAEIDLFVETIKELSDPEAKWSWARNWKCKYVELRFDMRDGGFILRDDSGQRISLEALKHQTVFESDARRSDPPGETL